MKFVHIADMHLDANFNSLNCIENLPEKRRLEQRKIMKKIIDYIKENDIEYLFIAGDLYEQEYIRRSTMEYINKLFEEIPDTKIFISPGNHDPLLKNSFYNTYNFSNNVHIFGKNIEKVEEDGVDIYGFGFTDFYCKNSEIENIKIEDKSKINILLVHGSLDGGNDDYREYNPLSKKSLNKLGFDYIALGHIHKKSYDEEIDQRIVYPGSTMALGFDELGTHGMVVGEFTNRDLKLDFVRLDDREYKEIEIDVSKMESVSDIVQEIDMQDTNSADFYKIILTGKRSFKIETKEIRRLLDNDNIVKLKDNTKIAYNINEISLQNDIKGMFVKKVLEKYEANLIDKETMEKVIEYGLEVL